ncbi:hypothetical protein, partial [Desulfosporosinus sp. OT]|uniref:hypothetical protein n=1 Tax=Desulfosporosinus sp. OT TaxID=913865 RepID=UPI001A9836C7
VNLLLLFVLLFNSASDRYEALRNIGGKIKCDLTPLKAYGCCYCGEKASLESIVPRARPQGR